MTERTFRMLPLFAGCGGGARGFQQASARWGAHTARWQVLPGVDFDPGACTDFQTLTGVPGHCADLATMTPEELRAVAGDEAPDAVFASPPCQGFSALLPRARSEEEHYQALNRLVLQSSFLVCETWRHRPPPLLLIENVPRITTRGAGLLLQLEQLLASYGYRWDRRTHDAGALGGLAQHRNRFLLLARHEKQLPAIVYQPPLQRVRAVGEVLADLPLPEDPAAGPLHRLPRLKWQTWVRLALIRAGGDWRDLPGGEYAGPAGFKGSPGLMGVIPWNEPSGTVTGSATVSSSNAAAAVADPRTGGARNVAPFSNVWRVVPWDQPSGAVTAGGGPSSSGICVADPRLGHAPRSGAFRVVRWDQPGLTVTGAPGIGHGNAYAVADPRLGCAPRSGTMGVLAWDQPASTVTGSADVHNGAAAVADPRLPLPSDRPDPPPVIIAMDGTWHRPLTTLELAALQGIPTRLEDGSPLRLAGRSDGTWRTRIGNAVPPPAAQAIAEQLLLALLQAEAGDTFALASTDRWVRPPLHPASAL